MTLRFRLTLGLIVVILIANASLSFFMVRYIVNVFFGELQGRIRLDLNSARQIYDTHVDEISRTLSGVSLQSSGLLSEASGTEDNLNYVLKGLLKENKLDALILLDRNGRVLYRANNPTMKGDDLSTNPLVSEVLKKWVPTSGTMVMSEEEIAREGVRLSRRASLRVENTHEARPTERRTESRGMMIAAAAPLLSLGNEQKVLGIIYGANLLNNRDDIVDKVRDTLFQNRTHDGDTIGTATIFLDDVRVSTNVKKDDGTRAVGTLMSAEVYDSVVRKGEIWARRAFVVNDWYIAAYEPIKDPKGSIIGALYVGLLETPLKQPRNLIINTFLVMVVLTTLVSLVLLFFVIQHTLSPISKIVLMSQKVIAGDLTARVGIRPPGEMGHLCETINKMADAVSLREERIRKASQEQIGQSDKLASIGRLAAGIAHEVNNPLTAVLTFAHLLRDASTDPAQKQDLEVIVRETTRVREIVRGLLDFARESPSSQEFLDINEVLRRTMALFRNQKEFDQVNVVIRLGEHLPPVSGDKNQIQQVFLNVCLNACEAMPDGGTLAVTTSIEADSMILVSFTDTGCGISEENAKLIFDPFFTTKPVGKGTGLGLSVTYGILQQHGGGLRVESKMNVGSVFTVVLPVCREETQRNEAGPM